MRDLGYDLPAAVADLVDNSIAAKATHVSVTVHFAGEDSWIRIADNGVGIPTETLNEAMRYGTEREYGRDELGKYGLGLKTASLSQCRRLIVATKRHVNAPMQIAKWDCDEVDRRNRWEVLRLSAGESPVEATDPLRGTKGTVVLWQGLDRVLAYRLPSGRAAETGLAALCREIEEHLAMVFHRFITGEARRRARLRITINGDDNYVRTWDPFSRGERATKALEPKELECKCGSGSGHTILVRPYVLPNQAQFSSIRVFNAAAGPAKWNRQQGFYIYRGDRMIQSGGWNRLRTSDEHTKLARVAVDFETSADCCFEINISKMRVYLPQDLRPEFATIAASAAAAAQAAYRQRGEDDSRQRGTGRAVRERGSRFDAYPSAEAVIGVLRRELRGHPRLLERVLRALVRADPEFGVHSQPVARSSDG